jgi:phosphatidylserine decarboxylase
MSQMERMNKERAWPFAVGSGGTLGMATAVLAAAAGLWRWRPGRASGALFGLWGALWLLLLYFFRDPRRAAPAAAGLVVGPGDGELIEIVRERETRFLNAEVVRLSIFLSITDVHVQRAPLGGRVTAVVHQPGRFLQAFRPEASQVNESIAMVLETEYGRILIKQIAGILARRCVNYAQPGQQVATGQRFGLIRFGSRLDLCLPPDARLLVQIGDKIVGGVTPIAQMANPPRHL